MLCNFPSFGLLSLAFFITRKQKPSITEKKVVLTDKEQSLFSILDYIHQNKHFRILVKEENFLKLETALSWRSFGEYITVHKVGDSIEVLSTPKLSLTVIDYDKNQKNIDFIKQLFNK